MRYKTLISAIVINMALSAGAYAAQEGMPATQFVQQASMSNLFELESSKLAQERSENAKVKDFASMMIKDHTKAGKDLEAAVKKSGMNAKAVAKSLDAEHEGKISTLQQKKGEDFDDTYISMQQDAHDKAVELFSAYAGNGNDKEIRSFASQTLPVLKKHQHHVETLD